ncbi:lytic transglycosylase domain-containing protein [Psychromarinibacter sp. S121]|uniref:lytic transglycosylase domain-containing protein n=1 Tax=Psychromarinibacter sp. S121 TaxID=3415127 RepID=UPI003C7DC823
MQRRLWAASLAAFCLSGVPVAAQTDMRPSPRPVAESAAADESDTTVVEENVLDVTEAEVMEDPAAEPVPEADAEGEDVSDLAVSLIDRLPPLRPDDLMTGHEFRVAQAAAARKDWELALKLAGAAADPVAVDLIEWQRLRSGEGTFADYLAFLERNADWPGLALLRRRGESEIPEGADPEQVVAYFGPQAPQTGRGAFRLARALDALGRGDDAKAEALRAWRGIEMSAREEDDFLGAYAETLKAAHEDRMDFLLWEQDRDGILRAKGRVGAAWDALADAREALQREAAGVDTLIGKVPASLQNNGGLAYDRFTWRLEKGRRDDAADLMIEVSTSAEALGRPAAWGNWRRILARQAMRDGDGARAYTLASHHYIPADSGEYSYSDLEWLAGYVALRYLDDPATALTHFRRFTASVFTPISLSRGNYWEGRALDAMGDAEAAQAEYRKGGVHQTTFYGLLAAEKAGVGIDAALVADGPEPDWRQAGFATSTVWRAAKLWHDAGEQWETIRFLSHLAEIVPTEELVALTDATMSLGDTFVSVRVAKQAASEGVVAPRAYFPLAGLGIDLPVEEALALSIARRESEFNVGAVSPAGARGLMQLMPGTAKLVSGKLGLPYVLSRLTTDGVYNATLGSAYLATLIEEFGPNYALVAAGYNAGPGRPRRWVQDYGDPRYPGTDPVDWVEHIPFRETRDYVMRVTESIPVYRARLTGKAGGPIGLTEILTAR